MSYDRAEEMVHFAGIEREPAQLCANCGHDKEAHWDRYGCQIEGADRWVEGNNCGALMAPGPCGCKDFKLEEEPLPDADSLIKDEDDARFEATIEDYSRSKDAALRRNNANSKMLLDVLMGHL